MNTNIIQPLSTCPRTEFSKYIVVSKDGTTAMLARYNSLYGAWFADDEWSARDCDLAGWIDWAGELQSKTVANV